MPAKEALLCEGGLKILCGVEHHLDDAFDITAGFPKPRDVEPKPACNGRPYLVGVQVFSFDG